MRLPHGFVVLLICLLGVLTLEAQKEKREPLTSAQIEEIREAGINPGERVKLYTKFLDAQAEAIKDLGGRVKSSTRSHRLDEQLQDFTALMDEFGSNLDLYSERHADIRKPLKSLTEATQRWLGILRGLAGDPVFELARKESVESGEDLAEQATHMLQEQTEYFKVHKDEEGQERTEPK
jgi:hypothetical protein